MKRKISKNPAKYEVSGQTEADSKAPDSSGKTKAKKKKVAKPAQKPARLYYSSPCLLSEMEDNEDILNI